MPLSWVVPTASVLKLAALTVLLNLVIPLLFAMRLPKAVVLPTSPVKVIFAVPLFAVKSWVPLTVLLKAIALLVVLS